MPTCIFRVQPNSLLSLWYTIGCTLLHSWLLYLGFVRYRLYMDMQWPTGAFPRIWLTIYISLLGTCIPILALFLAFGLLKSGNLAGDNERLGARPKRTIELIKGGMGNTAVRLRNASAYRLCHCLRSAWLHAPPAAQCLHVLLALLQLFVQQTMLAQLYRWGFINSGDFLSTELDWMFQRARQLATNLPMGETRLQSFRISTEELSASPVAPNILPILMHTRLFGIPLEFVNLLIALIAFSTAYPAVFWRVSKPFALLFTGFLGIHSLSLIWTYLGFSVLFRIQETNFYGGRPVGMGQHLWALRGLPLYHPLAIVASFLLTVSLMHIAPIALYSFGYGKFAATQNRLLRMRRSSSVPSDGGGGGCSKRSNGINGWSYGREIICDGYTPHVLAIVLLLTIAAVKAPAFYAIGLIYQKEERPFLLWCLVADLLYLFCWILLWLLCTVKCRWDFHVHYDVHELIGLQDAHKTADGGPAERGRAPSELKGALLLVHGSDVFITDDPVAKPAIMRQVLKSCLPAQDLPSWLRGAMPMQNSTVANTHSPQRRYVHAEYAPSVGQLPDIGYHLEAFRTPELGQRHAHHHHQHFGGAVTVGVGTTDECLPMEVPLAAPPYQRLASLPPGLPTAGDGQLVPAGTSFGTVIQQQLPHQFHQNNVVPSFCGGTTTTSSLNANNNSNDYAAFVHNNGQQQQQAMLHHQASQMAGIGTLSRSCNTGAGLPATTTAANVTTAQQQQMMASAMQQLHQHGLESYATISRRCSKSSVGSGFGTSVVPPTMPSPQLLRPKRSASVQTREHNVPIVQQRHNHQQQNGHDFVFVYGQQHNIYGQFNGGGTVTAAGTLQRNTGGGALLSGRGGGGTQSGGGAELAGHKPKLLTPLLQRRHPAPALMPQSTFTGHGGWQQSVPSTNAASMAPASAETSAGTSSVNGGGTTTPSSSVTIGGDSRVASAASNASSSAHATTTSYGGDIGTLNGTGGVPPPTTDCATLTRPNNTKGRAISTDEWCGRNGRDPAATVPLLEGKSDGTKLAGGQMVVPSLDGTERFATSVV